MTPPLPLVERKQRQARQRIIEELLDTITAAGQASPVRARPA
ncbi:MAG TPA: hypothetical protein VGH27_08815 [Streptosporangiaceae bacterium]|jgi:hypothetical protein